MTFWSGFKLVVRTSCLESLALIGSLRPPVLAKSRRPPGRPHGPHGPQRWEWRPTGNLLHTANLSGGGLYQPTLLPWERHPKSPVCRGQQRRYGRSRFPTAVGFKLGVLLFVSMELAVLVTIVSDCPLRYHSSSLTTIAVQFCNPAVCNSYLTVCSCGATGAFTCVGQVGAGSDVQDKPSLGRDL